MLPGSMVDPRLAISGRSPHENDRDEKENCGGGEKTTVEAVAAVDLAGRGRGGRKFCGWSFALSPPLQCLGEPLMAAAAMANVLRAGAVGLLVMPPPELLNGLSNMIFDASRFLRLRVKAFSSLANALTEAQEAAASDKLVKDLDLPA